MRRFVFLCVLCFTATMVAAPIPPLTEKQQIAKFWGKVHAPSDKYEFKLNNKALTIRTAGEPAREAAPNRASTIPRVTRTMTGDFEATVKVVAAATPNREAKYESGMPESHAGLQVAGGITQVQIELFQYFVVNKGVPSEQPNRVVWCNVRKGGNGDGWHIRDAKPPTPLYLRITRQKNVLTTSHSFDGKKWAVPLGFRQLELPDELSVSVYVAHSTHQILHATFADFTIEKTK